MKVRMKDAGWSVKAEDEFRRLAEALPMAGNDDKIFTIMSNREGEGKSEIILEMGRFLAEAGRKVLIMEANMRTPILEDCFERKELIRGLVNYLKGTVKIADIINVTDNPKLHIIFSGGRSNRPGKLLGSQNFTDFLEALRDAYDYILIDTPAIEDYADGYLVAKRSDGVLLIVESKENSSRSLRKIQDNLRRWKTPIIGIIMNKAKGKKRRKQA